MPRVETWKIIIDRHQCPYLSHGECSILEDTLPDNSDYSCDRNNCPIQLEDIPRVRMELGNRLL